MLIEGKNAVKEALNQKNLVQEVFVQDNLVNKQDIQEIITLSKKYGVNIIVKPKQYFTEKSKTGFNQGVMARVKDFEYCTVDDILNQTEASSKKAFILLIDEVSDPHNLGSIIRTAECAGVTGIIIPSNRSCLINETVIKVSTGAVYNTKIAKVTNLNDAIRYLKKQNIWIYAMEADGESIYKTDLTGNIGLVVGSEGFGVSKLTKQLCDGIVSLSLNGKINSLNASVACGICLYEVVRQRG